jgi:hypothetical protein
MTDSAVVRVEADVNVKVTVTEEVKSQPFEDKHVDMIVEAIKNGLKSKEISLGTCAIVTISCMTVAAKLAMYPNKKKKDLVLCGFTKYLNECTQCTDDEKALLVEAIEKSIDLAYNLSMIKPGKCCF